MKNSSLPDPVALEPPARPPASRLAIASLALVIAAPLVIVLDFVISGPVVTEVAPVLIGLEVLVGLVLAHVAYARIRASKGAIGGLGYAVAALMLGYLTIVLTIVGFVVFIWLLGKVFAVG